MWSFQLPILQPDLISYQVQFLREIRKYHCFVSIVIKLTVRSKETDETKKFQTLTIDLYAPLLLLVLLFSLMFTLLSCSCSRLSDQALWNNHCFYFKPVSNTTPTHDSLQYRLATDHARPQTELRARQEDPTTIMARWKINGIITSIRYIILKIPQKYQIVVWG